MTAPGSMPGYGGSRNYNDDDGGGYSGAPIEGKERERGARRKKLAGYLKAANDLRQTYSASYTEKWGGRNGDDDNDNGGIPGAFPDVAIVQHGDEEMVLFPSYARRHFKTRPKVDPWNSDQYDRRDSETNDEEYWRKQWEKYEDDKAIVDVDVRGWMYSPHRGPMTRKNRLLIGLARQLSGVPAPKSDKSRESSPDPATSLRARHEAHEAKRDQEKIAREAEEILKKGENEELVAERGGYSERPFANYDSDSQSIYGERRSNSAFRPVSRPTSPTSETRGRTSNNLSSNASEDDAPGPGHLPKRASWNQPSDMSQAELLTANAHLMARLRPFLTNPLVSTPITVFFYDEKKSTSRTIMTNEAGHFTLRAALDFVPTHVRVLASEHLSATEEVKIMEPKGVSLISDVDDTIKHSSIGSGAREIFRNAFIRDLGDLTIDGVKEWYNTMYDMGVGIHYVSNSPWQLFPVLVSFFRLAGLPPGSYHLKQYSGMLQGIFEPVAERKKGTLEKIMRDFPERRFLLIGDSGEADLEVYTDVVLANPGRIIGVFIRDVTTPESVGFFDSSMGPLNGDRRRGLAPPPDRRRSGDNRSSRMSSLDDTPDKRPVLPARPRTEVKEQTSSGPAMGMLIDLSEEPDEIVHESHRRILPRSMSDFEHTVDNPTIKPVVNEGMKGKTPPVRPSKPLALRGRTSQSRLDEDAMAKKKIAPPPPKPRRLASNESGISQSASSHHPLAQTQNTSDLASTPAPAPGYVASARQKVSFAYNSLPAASSIIPGRSAAPAPPPRARATATSAADDAPLPPPRRVKAAPHSHRNSWRNDRSTETSDDESYDIPTGSQVPVNKKVQLWKTRLAKAKKTLDREGVELRTWRVGGDVCLEAVRLVEKNLREMGVEGYDGEKKVKDIKR